VLSLAFGVGANTAIFELLDAGPARGAPRADGTRLREQIALEENLQCQLHVERLSRTDARRTPGIADGVADRAQSAAQRGCRGLREVHAV